MYIWKYENLNIRNQLRASKCIGITPQYLSNICGRKVAISKTLAYCIVKYINFDAEIEDYFEKKGE